MPTQALIVAADHPAYAGHFPGRPILPGVVLLDLAQHAIEQATGLTLTGLPVAKFHRPVSPGQALTLDYAQQDSAVRFTILHGQDKVADGRFSSAPEDAS